MESYPHDLATAIAAWMPAPADRSHFQNEIGLYDPSSMSLVKIRRGGSIDLFAGTNEGIRIDPEKHRIHLFSNEVRAVAEAIRLEAVDSLQAIASSILMTADTDIHLEAAGTIYLKAKHIVLDAATYVDVV